jgi:hypothetical protein
MGRTATQRDERNSEIDYLRAPAPVKTPSDDRLDVAQIIGGSQPPKWPQHPQPRNLSA